uniref:LIM domain-binding protein 2 n=1 Tax=Timema cristinae TaxID=61476 RepID=A0A7R9CC24_TIMCR|nr:unnamed protein product [Timema cristinae]
MIVMERESDLLSYGLSRVLLSAVVVKTVAINIDLLSWATYLRGISPNIESDNLWWDAFATEFFEDDATLTLTFCLEDGPKRYTIGRTLIPRYFRSIFEGGVTELYYNLRHPKESFHNTSITLDCDQCTMVTHHGKPMFTKVCTEGRLILEFTFDDLMRIKSWHFAVRTHRELVPRSVVGMHTQQDPGMLDQLSKNITRQGITNSTLNYLRVSITVHSVWLTQLEIKLKIPPPSERDKPVAKAEMSGHKEHSSKFFNSLKRKLKEDARVKNKWCPKFFKKMAYSEESAGRPRSDRIPCIEYHVKHRFNLRKTPGIIVVHVLPLAYPSGQVPINIKKLEDVQKIVQYLCVILEPMQELMSRHKAYALSPRDCLKTTLFQKWQRMVAPPALRISVQSSGFSNLTDTGFKKESTGHSPAPSEGELGSYFVNGGALGETYTHYKATNCNIHRDTTSIVDFYNSPLCLKGC